MEPNSRDNSGGFSYNYSALEQTEIRSIRQKYSAPTEPEDKLARLRRLDGSVTKAAQAIALVFGIVGSLILGLGMSLCMTDLGLSLGLEGIGAMAVGVAVGLVGGILASLAYPVYTATVRARRRKLAPEILRLSDELMR